jgi:peptidoglycan/LPS O-acetylase OafA/YrhL
VKGGAIGEALSDRHNSLNFLRLALALMVVASHAYGIGYFGTEGVLHGTTFGTVAVDGFFGISGYLIASSATRNNAGRYLWQRFLRIFPGFWVALIVTAFVFGAIGWFSQPHACGAPCYVRGPNGATSFVWRNALLRIDQDLIHGESWNGSLWTLFYEFICYIILVTLALAGMLRRRGWTLALTVGLWVTVAMITMDHRYDQRFNVDQNWILMNLLKFAVIFLVGAVIYLYRERVPDSGWLALGCLVVFTAALWLPTDGRLPAYAFTDSDLLAPLIAYPLLWLGIHLPFQRVGARNDYSYGVYIYAYPVTVLLSIWGATRLGYPLFALVCALATVPFAVASWWAVEKRALSLKRLGTSEALGARPERKKASGRSHR